MKSHFRSAFRVLAGTALTAAVGLSSAQTPAQLEYERQQREYWRQQEQQRQEQQRQQQIMQDNARRQQEESSRINAPTSSGQPQGGAASSAPQGRGADPTGAQAYSAARAMCSARRAGSVSFHIARYVSTVVLTSLMSRPPRRDGCCLPRVRAPRRRSNYARGNGTPSRRAACALLRIDVNG